VNASDKARAADGRRRAAEAKIAETDAYITKKSATLGEEAVADARDVLAQAQALIEEGAAQVEAGDTGTAFRTFQEAHLLADRAKVVLVMSAKLGITVRGQDGSGHQEDRGHGRSDEDRDEPSDDMNGDDASPDHDEEGATLFDQTPSWDAEGSVRIDPDHNVSQGWNGDDGDNGEGDRRDGDALLEVEGSVDARLKLGGDRWRND